MIAAVIVTASIAALDAVTIKNNNQAQSIILLLYYSTDGYASANYHTVYNMQVCKLLLDITCHWWR